MKTQNFDYFLNRKTEQYRKSGRDQIEYATNILMAALVEYVQHIDNRLMKREKTDLGKWGYELINIKADVKNLKKSEDA